MMIKYVLIITSEDERYNNGEKDLGYWTDNPWDGLLNDIVFGNSVDTLWKSENEGLFYILYALDSGKRIGYGCLDGGSLEDDINMYEGGNV